MEIKKRGNDLFGEGKYDEAAQCYTAALRLPSAPEDVRLTLYKNRAASYLKLVRNENAQPMTNKKTPIF